jgi:3-phosphoshikimate 1-carboxyvinyltransferase
LDLKIDLKNLSDSEDTKLLLKALQQIKRSKNKSINIHNAGTDMRFLTALLAIKKGTWTITGSERMKKRPIGELVTALKSLGAEIEFLEKENYPPLEIKGKIILGGALKIDASQSSQFISALLLISPKLKNGLVLTLKNRIVSSPYIEMTAALLKKFNVPISKLKNTYTVNSRTKSKQIKAIKIESDWSSASYWYSICALSKNAKIELNFLNKKSLQSDSILPELYKILGVETKYKKNSIIISRKKLETKSINYNFINCPDIAQTFAVTCFGLGICAKLIGLSTLKFKESDRIIALKTELEKMGAKLVITNNSIELKKSKPIPFEGIIETYNDHRMAMSFSPLALVYNSIKIANPEVVSKSYPRFWKDLKSVGFSVNLGS